MISPSERRNLSLDTRLTPDELKTFRALLDKYLDTICSDCGEITPLEDRHIVTCACCGKVLGDLKNHVLRYISGQVDFI